MSSALRVGLVGLDHWYTAVPLAEEMAKRDNLAVCAAFYDAASTGSTRTPEKA